MSSYIPNETKVSDDQNPPWMNAEVEKLITAKMRFLKNILKNNRNHYYTCKYKVLQGKLENLIESSKQSYRKKVKSYKTS